MIKQLGRIFIMLSAVCAFVSCCSKKPTVGGYFKVSVANKDVLAAAKFAITAHSKVRSSESTNETHKLELLKVLQAEQQVVAGTNHRLTLRVNDNGSPVTVKVIVWEQSWRKPNPYQLTSWR